MMKWTHAIVCDGKIGEIVVQKFTSEAAAAKAIMKLNPSEYEKLRIKEM